MAKKKYTTSGSMNLGNQILLKNKNSNIDQDYGPYQGYALDEIAESLKDTIQAGKTIGLMDDAGNVTEYIAQPKNGGGLKFVQKPTKNDVDNLLPLIYAGL